MQVCFPLEASFKLHFVHNYHLIVIINKIQAIDVLND